MLYLRKQLFNNIKLDMIVVMTVNASRILNSQDRPGFIKKITFLVFSRFTVSATKF